MELCREVCFIHFGLDVLCGREPGHRGLCHPNPDAWETRRRPTIVKAGATSRLYVDRHGKAAR